MKRTYIRHRSPLSSSASRRLGVQSILASLYFPLLLLSALLCGCEPDHPPASADLSTPKSAALVYLKAIQRGDSKTARSVSVGSAEEKRWVDALATMVDGMRFFDNALYARFGRYTNQVHTDLFDSLVALADGPVEWIGQGAVDSDESKARIDPKHTMSFASKSQPSIYLLLGKDGWMVNLDQTYAEGATPEQIRELSASYAIYRQIGQAMRTAAGEVKAGKFRSLDDATQALGEQLKRIKANSSAG